MFIAMLHSKQHYKIIFENVTIKSNWAYCTKDKLKSFDTIKLHYNKYSHLTNTFVLYNTKK